MSSLVKIYSGKEQIKSLIVLKPDFYMKLQAVCQL